MRVVLATKNAGKLREFRELFKNSGIEIHSAEEFSIPEVHETGKTFFDNALIKAQHAARFTDLPVIADDSGLEINALAGAPGIYSARYAGEKVPFIQHIQKVLNKLKNVPEEKRTARFRCVLVYLKNSNASPIMAEGLCEGSILFEPVGEHGFGYDPIFYVPEENCSMAELPEARKNQLSHRARAVRQLLKEI